jgi:hypothetical protein
VDGKRRPPSAARRRSKPSSAHARSIAGAASQPTAEGKLAHPQQAVSGLAAAPLLWRAVDIGPDGWRVIGYPPVRFRRPAGMLPLPVPQRGGSIESVNSFLNLASRDDFVLIVVWLLAALRSGGPYPLLAISGEQGSAKTVLSKLLKALTDPNAAPVRALSREERELMIAASILQTPHSLTASTERFRANGGLFCGPRMFML